MDLIGAARQLQTAFEAAGVPAGLALSDLAGDGVLINPPNIAPMFGPCWSTTWTVYVLSGDVGAEGSLGVLGPLLETVAGVLPAWETCEAVSIQSPDGGNRPGYRITFTVKIDKP